ncbi:MAG: SH3 domain-containing protein [Lachnospiraceae bacterium]
MKKKYIVIPVAALAALGIGTGVFLANDKVKLVKDNLVVEAGADLNFDINKYVDASESKIEKLTVDTSKVDTSKVGEYEIKIIYKKQELTVKVKVTDTVAPVIEQPEKALKAKVGEKVLIEKLALSVKDASDYTLTFEDGETTTEFKESGEVKKKIIATDQYGNKSETELTFQVLDANPPVFEGYGTKDRTLYLENGIDLMDGVFAKDAEDGDLTKKIKVSKVNTKKVGKKKVTYTVTDKSGNKTTLTVNVKIESVVEKMDKTMYATSAVNLRDSSSADGKKIGDIAFAEELHVVGRDKNTGWFKVECGAGTGWVSSDYTSDTKPVVEVPQQTTNTTTNSGGNGNTNCASANCDCDCQSANCNCDCDCQAPTPADCDCQVADCDCACDCDCDCQAPPNYGGDCTSPDEGGAWDCSDAGNNCGW